MNQNVKTCFLIFLCLLAFSIGAYVSRAKIEYEKDQTDNPVTRYLRENYGVDSFEEYIAKLEQEIRASYTFQNEENQTDLQPKLQEKLSSGTAAYADLNSILRYLDDYTPTTWQNIPRGGTETYQPTYLKSEAKPQYVNFSFNPLTELAAFSFFGTAFTALLMIPKTGKKLLKHERLVWLIILIAAVGIAFSLGQVYSQTQSPNRYFDAYELPYSYMISTDGTYYYATRYDGYLAFGGPANRSGVNGTDASAVIQSAINALTAGGKILVKAGTYLLTSTINIVAKSSIVIEGEGRSTVFKRADYAPIRIFQVDSSTGIGLRNFMIDGNRANQNSQQYGINVTGAAAANVLIEKVAVKSWYGNPINLYQGSKIVVRNCVVEDLETTIVLQAIGLASGVSDVIIEENNVEGQIALNGTGVVCVGNVVHGGHWHSGIYAWGGATLVAHNYVTGVESGQAGIEIRSSGNVVVGNSLIGNAGDGIQLNAYAETVTDNVVAFNIVKGNGGFGIHLTRTTGTLSRASIIGNTIIGNLRGVSIDNVVMDRIDVIGNVFSGNTLTIYRGATPTNVRISHNIGYVTENSGTATITAGSTYVDVAHGLAITPDVNRIKVVPKDNLGGRSFWVSDVGATTFRINISSTDTVDHTFGWSYE